MNYDHFDELAARVTHSLRLGMEAEASERLVHLIDAIPLMMQNIAASQINSFNEILISMFEAQGRGDHLFLADLIEYELPKVLKISKGIEV